MNCRSHELLSFNNNGGIKQIKIKLRMKKILLMIVVATTMATPLWAQSGDGKPDIASKNSMYLGLGGGFDYGGFGGRLEFLPTSHFGLFGGLGYNLLSVGWNLGASYKFLPNAKVSPTVCAFYGYNAVLKVENAEEYNITSYGVTFGGGVNIKLGRRGNMLSINLFVPIRSEKFKDNYDAVKNDPRIEMKSELLPIGISVGYNFRIK
jgi:hypothetical protein